MTTPDSHTLLTEYATCGSEAAFRQLASQYIDLVYSTALRRVNRDRALAEDVTQTVFVDLARAARTFRGKVMLGGWLHRHTCFVAAKAVRREQRRAQREREAVAMKLLEDTPDNSLAELGTVLDEVIDQLGGEDRTAILLRFFERQNFRSLGQAIGTSEDAARMRVNRALEKLQGLLKARGVTLSLAALGTWLTTDAVSAAPTGLASSVTGAALVSGSGGFGLAVLIKQFTGMLGGATAVGLLALGAIAACTVAGYLATRSSKPPAKNSAGDGTDTGLSAVQVDSERRVSPRPPATAATATVDLDALKQELRAVLKRPLEKGDFPADLRRRTVQRFRHLKIEAVPVLLEALEVPDHETRRLALDGIWELLINCGPPDPTWSEFRLQSLALVSVKLRSIFGNEHEAGDLRRMAAQALLPAYFDWSRSYRQAAVAMPMDAETSAVFLKVLQSEDRRSEGFRFEVAELLAHQAAYIPEDASLAREAVTPWLKSPDFGRHLLAAYTLALCPGERPPEGKTILIHALEAEIRGDQEGLYAYRAADALGALGGEAKDSVPTLLRYAEVMKERFSNGSREHALEAACRIDASLRAQHPEIDAKLKQFELAPQLSESTVVRGRHYWGSELADPRRGTNALASLLAQVRASEDPARERQRLLEELLTLWGKAPEKERESLLRAMDQLRAIPDSTQAARLPAPSLRVLVLDARLTTVDHPSTNQARLDDVLNQWDAYYKSHAAEEAVTKPRFEELSQSIQDVDPVVHQAWLKQILDTTPSLDRLLGNLVSRTN